MKTQHVLAFGAVLSFAAFEWMRSTASSDVAVPAVRASVAEIGSKVILVGRLGKPLGTMMEVKGTWAYPDRHVKDYSLRFTVSHVNSQRLAAPIVFNVAQIDAVSRDGKNAIPQYSEHKSLDGVSWVFRAYESGRINEVPAEYWTERGSGIPACPYWFRPFTSELVGVVEQR